MKISKNWNTILRWIHPGFGMIISLYFARITFSGEVNAWDGNPGYVTERNRKRQQIDSDKLQGVNAFASPVSPITNVINLNPELSSWAWT